MSMRNFSAAMLRFVILFITLCVTLLVPLPGRADPLYTVSLLPDGFSAVDINNAGQIAGNFADATSSRAALYDNGVLTELGSLGGGYSLANGLNEAGDVTGVALTSDGVGAAFVYRNGVMTSIGTGMQGFAINNHGDVAGVKYVDPAAGTTGFVYRDGIVTVIPNLGTGVYGQAADLNDHGDVVGESFKNGEPAHPPLHPFLYRDGVVTDLGTLAGQELNGAIGINNASQIAGYSVVTNQDWHVFLYENGVMSDLGNFGGRDLDVGDLNEHGTIVGTGRSILGDFVPFQSIGVHLVDLNTLIDPASGWRIATAVANNDAGQIIGYGCRDDVCGSVRLDLAGAVPEPGTLLALSAGLMTVAGTRWRRRRCPSDALH